MSHLLVSCTDAPETAGLAMVMDDVDTHTALHAAAQGGEVGEMRALLRQGLAVDAVSAANGATPLFFASGLGHCDAVRVLLDAGAAVNMRAKQGLTPLHVAVAGGHATAVEMLLERGGNREARDENGHTPFDLARQLGHEVVARILQAAPAAADASA